MKYYDLYVRVRDQIQQVFKKAHSVTWIGDGCLRFFTPGPSGEVEYRIFGPFASVVLVPHKEEVQ